jgi:hypothetical protein
MHRSSEQPSEPGPVGALLLAASEDVPAMTDPLRKVRERARRRRALVPSLAGLGAVGVVAAVVLAATTVVGTAPAPASARELVGAAVSRTASEGYRVRVTSSKNGDQTGVTEGVYDPASRTGRMVAISPDAGHVTIHVRDRVYVQIPPELVGRQPGIPASARWLLRARGLPRSTRVSELAEFGRLAMESPRRALDLVRSAGDVRERGPVGGDGWSGTRYAFTLTDQGFRVTGTVDVDTDGRVRRLEFTSRASDTGNGVGGTLRAELTFRDFGIRERVVAPPRDEVFEMPVPEKLKRELDERRARMRSGG